MTVKTGISADTPDRIIIDAGAVYLNYGLGSQRLLGATRGGNEFNLNRTSKNIEIDGLKGAVKGLKRIIEVNPQITANLLELSVDNLIAAIGGANQSDLGYVELEHIAGAAQAEFDLLQNKVVENSEKVYVKDAAGGVGTLVEQTRTKKYASRFVGDNAVDNKGFDAGYGNWENAAGNGTLELSTGGLSGNCLKFTGAASVTTTFLTLPGGDGGQLTNLVVDEYYRLQIAVKGKPEDDWIGGAITVKCAGGASSITVADPAGNGGTDWMVYEIVFKATGTDATITLVAASEPTTGSVYIDSLELRKVDYQDSGDIAATGQFGYIIKREGGTGKKASIIFMNNLADNDVIVINYTYAKSSPDHTIITGGEIEDSDYIDNVAIVGNVSGKTKPVICMVKNALADAGFSLATAPRDEAVPAIVFTGHYDPDDLDSEPWEIRWPNS